MLSGLTGVRRQALDGQQAESVLRLMGYKRRKRERVWQGLRVMEDEALQVLYAPESVQRKAPEGECSQAEDAERRADT